MVIFIVGGKHVEFLTTVEIAEIWNISARRVALLCSQNRIDGAVKKGKTWLIPCSAKKPEDPRRAHKIESNK